MNPLCRLLALPEEEKQARGLQHTPKEIAQQPETWLRTFECFRQRHGEIQEFLQSAGVGAEPSARPAVFLVGAGTSDYVGRSLAPLLRRLWHCEVSAVPSTDLLTHADECLVPGRRYLWISFSRSGESPEGVAVIERALQRNPDIHHLVVSCNQSAPMLRLAAGCKQALGNVLPDATHDRGLAMTSSFSNMVIFGQCLAHIESLDAYQAFLQSLVRVAANFLDPAASCADKLANEPFTSVCFTGSGALKAVATESALKVLELTAGEIRTMSESVLGLRHGPMAALDKQTLLVVFLSSDPTVLRYEVDLLEEIGRKHLLKTRALVSPAPHKLDGYAEYVLAHTTSVGTGGDGAGSVTEIPDVYRPPLDVIFGQLLGLFFSLRCGLKPDCPSPNGAISRVVQHVRIHD